MDGTQLSPETAGLSRTASLPCPILSRIVGMAFAVATCPKCSERFRLIWRIGKRKLPWSQLIRLTCPGCENQFQQVAVELVIFGSGAEEFPEFFIVEPSA